ncbi:MAG TPA: ATP-binding cassette domain-containing protein, partial [Methylomirabilota bacterium]|nr:ATP-binding cassette domain-containing protein [Methylomirabilota bacterium]
MSLLEVRRVTKRFGALVALNDVEFALTEHEILGIIGPNGAGKSTLFNLISGLDRPSAGDVVYRGRSLAGLRPDAVCRLGIAKT